MFKVWTVERAGQSGKRKNTEKEYLEYNIYQPQIVRTYRHEGVLLTLVLHKSSWTVMSHPIGIRGSHDNILFNVFCSADHVDQ